MKIQITFKPREIVFAKLRAENANIQAILEMEDWIDEHDLISIEFDTDTMSAKVAQQ